MRINDTFRTDIIAVFKSTFDGGRLRIYTGAIPGANAAPTGTMLIEITLPANAFVAGTAGVMNRNGTWSNAAVAGGTAGYAEIANAAGTRRIYLTVSGTGGTGQVQIQNEQATPTTTIVQNGTFTVSTATLTQPAQ